MRTITLQELHDKYGGKLPADAVLRSDDDPPPTPAEQNRTPEKRHTGRRGGRGERFAVLNTFTDCALAKLTGSEAKVWLILFRDTKAATGTARTGQADLARRAGLSERAVRYALTGLEAKGLVVVMQRGKLGRGPTTYRVRATGAA
jgi:DNA-binding transcriptional ArsR family regulator